MWTAADIQVSAEPTAVAESPEAAVMNAQMYAEAGLWYDAIAQVYSANTVEEKRFRQDLLLDLAELEAQTGEDSAAEISSQLQAIAETP